MKNSAAHRRPTQPAYARAGVDISRGNRVKAGLPQLLCAASRPEVLGRVGGFGGLFALRTRRYRQPVLVSSVDGVGTKLKVALAMDRHDTIGQDLVNHCVNDIAVLGAEPLFFLDYLGLGQLQPAVFKQIISGFARGCAANGCALIGGETAQLPGMYAPGEYDVSGTIVGVVEKAKLIDGRSIQPGDAVVGVASSGLHTNGYSLARRVFFETLKLKPQSSLPELDGASIGEELLKVHLSYWPLIQALLRRFHRRRKARHAPIIGAFAHITGGGLIDNIPRVLPPGCDVRIDPDAWTVPPVFRLIQRHGQVPAREMYHVFNMGIGLVAIVRAASAGEVLAFTNRRGHSAWLIGEVTRGRGKVRGLDRPG